MTLNPLSTMPALLHSQISGSGTRSLVCIHELGGSLDSFTPILPGLAPHCRILRYDQRGHGRSLAVTQDYAMADHVDDLARVLDASNLAAPYWLIGIAAGAAIAVAFSARYPEKTAGLMLCSPALGMDAARAAGLRQRAAQAIHEGMAALVDSTLARSWPAHVGNPQAAASYRTHLLHTDAIGYALANRALADYAPAADLARVQCPVLLLAGAHDQVRQPAMVEALCRSMPQAQYRVLDGAHLLPLQASQALLQTMLAYFNEEPI